MQFLIRMCSVKLAKALRRISSQVFAHAQIRLSVCSMQIIANLGSCYRGLGNLNMWSGYGTMYWHYLESWALKWKIYSLLSYWLFVSTADDKGILLSSMCVGT